MAVAASAVKELRERTGAGMMECKKALVAADGDMEGAIEALRKSGAAKAVKKSGRTAAEGVVKIATGDNPLIMEVNCETDFVAGDENFTAFADKLLAVAAESDASDVAAVMASAPAGSSQTLEEERAELVAKIGENISLRRFDRMQVTGGNVGSYIHGGGQIGVLVDLEGGDATLAKHVAMHVAGAGTRPICVDESQVPAEVLEQERQIFVAQAEESGKPPEIIEKMVGGRLKKFVSEVTLLGQPFIMDGDKTVGKLVAEQDASVKQFIYFKVGEGIEKDSADFADEVMQQVRDSQKSED